MYSRKHRRGANAIEFSLILPIFTLMIASVVDFGWLFFERAALNHAVIQACRAGSLVDPGVDDSNIDTVEEVAIQALKDALEHSGSGACHEDCALELSMSNSAPSRMMLCTARRDVDSLAGMVIGGTVLESHIAVRMEWQR